ncbi:MAG: hypothetical protein V1798_02485 [Pseudomonadota bacterium]
MSIRPILNFGGRRKLKDMKDTKTGAFGLVEMMISLVVFLVMGLFLFTFLTKQTRKFSVTLRNTKSRIETDKAMDRMYSEIGNAVSLFGSLNTVLGNSPPPDPIPQATGTPVVCTKEMMTPLPTLFGNPVPLIPHGLVALPGQTVETLDQDGRMTFMDPSGAVPADSASDAIRVAYVPASSTYLFLKDSTVVGNESIVVNQTPSGLKVGDYAVIADSKRSELFRVTRIQGTTIEHRSSLSFWNLPFQKTFDAATGFVQRVEIATLAHSSTEKALYQDNHVLDDGFNPSTRWFSKPGQRIRNFTPLAMGMKQLRIWYEVWKIPPPDPPKESRETRTPKAGPKMTDALPGCENEIGYPYFQRVRLELVVEDLPDDKNPDAAVTPTDVVVVREVGPETIVHPVSAPPINFVRTPQAWITPTPVPTVPGNPNPGPTATATVGPVEEGDAGQ